MKRILAVVALLLPAWPLAAQEVIVKRGDFPQLPAAAKWIGSKKPLKLDDFKGKIVIVHFWDKDSDVCDANFKVFEKWLAAYLPANLQAVGIHGPDLENNPEFKDIEKKALTLTKVFPTAVVDTDLTMKEWKVEQVPMTFLLDKKGKLRYAWEGQIVYRRFRGDLLLGEKLAELFKEK